MLSSAVSESHFWALLEETGNYMKRQISGIGFGFGLVGLEFIGSVELTI